MNMLKSVNSVAAGASATSFVVDHPGREQELKFSVDTATFKAAQALPLFGEPAVRPAWRRLRTTYFDTEQGDLRRHGIVLRMRRGRGHYLMGLKGSPDGHRSLFDRSEVELKVRAAEPNPAMFDKEIAANIARMIDDRALAPTIVSDIRRSTRTVDFAGSTIEVAFDSGFLIAGARRERVCEIELELKAGEPSALYQFGLSLVDAAPVTLDVRSKAERGTQLISGAPPPVRSIAPAITPQTSVDEAIGILFRNCLAQFMGNWPVIALGDAEEAVHQMRVSMRQLRAAIGLFHRAFPCAEFEGFQVEARRIATALGEARDWDVFVNLARSGPLSHFGDKPGFAALLGAAQRNADAGRVAASALLSAASTTRFILSMEQFIARRGWRNAVGEDRFPWLAQPVAGFAAQSLERLDRQMRKRGRRFGSLPPDARHKLRISVKRLRYATDFFGCLFRPPSAVRRFARRAAALQNMLGQCNDATDACRMIDQLDISASADLACAAGIIAGWCGRGSVSDEASLRSAWRSLLKVERFWRGAIDEPEVGASA